MQSSLCVFLLLLCSMSGSVTAHGKLTKPTPRDGITIGRAGLDENNPVSFEPRCTQENTCDAFVCRESTPNPNVIPTAVVAGGRLDLEWSFTALHVGDCAVYVSYDVEKPRSQQQFVKIANLPDCKSYTTKSIVIPPALPQGRAILRWDWVALHVWPTLELFVQCADIVIDSSSQIMPANLNSFSITNPPIYPVDGNDGVGYRNAFSGASSQSMTGPSCIDGTLNDCQLTAPGTQRNTDSRRGHDGQVSPGVTTPIVQPSARPTSQSQPTAEPTAATTPHPAPQNLSTTLTPIPTSQPTQAVKCVSNHPTIDYSQACTALVATCELHSFCKSVSVDVSSQQPQAPATECVSNHASIDFSATCAALAATCDQYTYCKRVPRQVPASAPRPEAEPEPESETEAEAEPEVESESEPESEGEEPASVPSPEAEPEPESETEAEPEHEAEPGAKPSEPEPEPEPQGETEAEVEPEAETESEPELEGEAQAGAGSESNFCVPIGDCGAYGWCDQHGYVSWCRSEAQALSCPALFCKIVPNLAQLRQPHHRSPRLRAHRTLGVAFFQHSSILDDASVRVNDDDKSEVPMTCSK